MKLNFNYEIILNILDKKPDLGKTAIMKMVYILQQVFDVKTNYSFGIYTYGPYSRDVSEDLDFLVYGQFVDAQIYEYEKFSAYKFSVSSKGIESKGTISQNDDKKISSVLELFGDKKVKELELDSTIIFINHQYNQNKWEKSKSEIISDVRDIKSHFTESEVGKAYDNLIKSNMLA